MAEKSMKHPENVPGAWYVDRSCIYCGLCSEYAAGVFRYSPEADQNIVFHQPETEQELKEALEARESCPTDSIGNDGAS